MSDADPTPPADALRRYRALLAVMESVIVCRDLHDLFRQLSERLQDLVPSDYVALVLHDPATDTMTRHVLHTTGTFGAEPSLPQPPEESPSGWVLRNQLPLVIDDLAAETRWPKTVDSIRRFGVRATCIVPLTTAKRPLGTLGFGRMTPVAFTAAEAAFVEEVARLIAVAVENAIAFREIADLKDKLAQEKVYLEGEIRGRYNFEEIVGESAALRGALAQVEVVAPTDATVLVRGESGTGKELIARALHDLSRRRERTLVKINCAAIPTGLLESELFGHEKGAFTGAIAQKIGRFELADGGTLFLDEVGDIAPELQPKLLRVLQEREFERIGGTRTQRIDVRIVAATNRDLAAMVEARTFRGDLYYRLNVFPIALPSLRERREDVPALVRYFTQTAARRMNKRIETIPAETLDALCAYDWPGNVRELENFVERAVILSEGPELRAPLADLRAAAARAAPRDAATLLDVERAHILEAVRASRWVLGGPAGAAARLGMKPTTLQSRLVKLGIRKPD